MSQEMIDLPQEYLAAEEALLEARNTNTLTPDTIPVIRCLVDHNEGHYTAWVMLRKIIGTDSLDLLSQELFWTREFCKAHPKGYQVWHHRQVLCERLNNEQLVQEEVAMVTGEMVRYYDIVLPLMERALETGVDFELDDDSECIDPKNYHAWLYLLWMCRRWPKVTRGLMGEACRKLLELDPDNNSATNFMVENLL
jgi:hypothetical protein